MALRTIQVPTAEGEAARGHPGLGPEARIRAVQRALASAGAFQDRRQQIAPFAQIRAHFPVERQRHREPERRLPLLRYRWPSHVGTDGNIEADPMLSENGRPAASSSALNAGDDAYATGSQDLDGRARLQETHVDIVAFEVGSAVSSGVADATLALKVAAELAGPGDAYGRLNAIDTGTSTGRLDGLDAVTLLRRALRPSIGP